MTMSIDINSIHNLATAFAEQERNENNRRHPGSRDVKHETREETNRKAAEMTIAILVYSAIFSVLWKFLKYLGKLSIEAFGPKKGRIINIVGLGVILFIPACVIVIGSSTDAGTATGNDIYRQQREAREIKEREEIDAHKTQVRDRVERDAKEYGIEGERLDIVLNTFDEKVYAYLMGNAISKESAMAGIDRAERECWEKLPKYDAPLIEEYLNQKLSEVKQVAKIRIEKLKESGHLEKVSFVEYQVDQVDKLKYAGCVSTTVFEEAKAIIDETVDNAIREIEKY